MFSLPLSSEVSRVDTLQQLTLSFIATLMASWSGDQPEQQHPMVNAASVAALPVSLKERLLTILTCRLQLSDWALPPLLFASLRSLDLSMCPLITDRALHFLTTQCPDLETLSLRGCKLSERATLAFLERSERLAQVDVTGIALDKQALNAALAAHRYGGRC